MRYVSFLVLIPALAGLGCSHAEKKSAAVADAKAVAAPIKKTEAPKTASTGTKVECSVKDDARVLEIRAKGKGCELAYTKAGNEGIVASATHGTDYCDKAFEKLRDKLKGSGYDCK